MRYLTIEAVLELHRLVITQSGGGSGERDPNALDSALALLRMTFRRGEPAFDRRGEGRRLGLLAAHEPSVRRLRGVRPSFKLT